MIKIPVFGCDQRLDKKRRNVPEMNIRPVLYEELIDWFAVGRDDARRNIGMWRFEFGLARKPALHVPPKENQQRECGCERDVDISATRGHYKGEEILSLMYSFTAPIATRTCCIESRSRIVTVWSCKVSE